MTYLSITLHYWGRGKTPYRAIRNMLEAGGRSNARSKGYVLLSGPESMEVDPIDGSISVEHGDAQPTVIKDVRNIYQSN